MVVIPGVLAIAAIWHATVMVTERRAHRALAAAIERRARPDPPIRSPADADELQLLRDALRHACCAGWWTQDREYRHHPDCAKDHHHA